MDKQFPLVQPYRNPYKNGLTLEHVDDQPQTFYSRKSIEKFCEQKGLSVGAIE